MRKFFIKSILAVAIISTYGCKSDETVNNYYQENNQKEEVIDAPNYHFVEEDWYRDIRFSDWGKMGVSEELVTSVLSRINGQGGELRDETNLDQKGYWTYEFSQEANRILEKAIELDDAELYKKASTLFGIASYPNLRRSHEIYAMDKALTYYITALEMEGDNIEKVSLTLADGASINGVLHMPTTSVSGKIPAMIWSGGVDKSLIEHRTAIDGVLRKGYAVLTLDMPGAGTDHKRSVKAKVIDDEGNVIQTSTEASSYQAAYNYLTTLNSINAEEIGILTSSGSGVSLFEFVLNGEHKLKAVIARCTLVDGPLTDLDLMKEIPAMSAHAMIARMGGDPGDITYFNKNASPLSLKTKGYFSGHDDRTASLDIPILGINADGDPIASEQDLRNVVAFSYHENSNVVITDEFGHCPELPVAQDIIDDFILNNVGNDSE